MSNSVTEPTLPTPLTPRNEDVVLRAESFSAERLDNHAHDLARRLKPNLRPGSVRDFFRRFNENAARLRSAYETVSAAIQAGESLTPDAEWLLDNFYVVEEHLREIRDDLPRPFYRELPKLESGKPRVYEIALELVVHTDSALDEESVVRFLREFQTVAPLSIGEVWAAPIMLRLTLVENLRRLADQMLLARECRRQAAALWSQWHEHADFPLELAALDGCASLVLQLLERLDEEGATGLVALKRLEQQLADHGHSPQDIVRHEHQRQAANQVSIGNVITSMRLISALDWVSIFERVNLTERVLRQDPAEVYAEMDFETRDRYRHVVEELSKRTEQSEIEVARHVLSRCLAASAAGRPFGQRHVGYWLVDSGLCDVESDLRYRPPVRSIIQRWLLRHPHFIFLGCVLLFIGIGSASIVLLAAWLGLSPAGCVAAAILALLPVSELAVAITNLLVTAAVKPRLLPKLEFKSGIPDRYSTFVVIPCLMSSRGEIKSLLSHLEGHYLANPEPALKFALLTDFTDAAQERLDTDDDLVALAVAGIRSLNARYRSEGRAPFHLFHRERRWNASQGRWMGWERKRGKLMEFNRLLHGKKEGTSYVLHEGDPSCLGTGGNAGPVKFVITLDADTQLPHGTARRLVGALAHPLNRPRYDATLHRVNTGYTVLQPRVSVHLGSANRSRYAQLFANSPGIDPYTTCASDVYQDLFGEGSFTGKGIYDVAAFEQSLDGTLPENQILSHDLIEGCFARVALVTDIELIDGFPARYDADARRQHRWVRGDWQILPWLLPRVPTAERWRQNPLSLLSRWKIFDNLRRSVVPPAALALLLVGWLAWPQAAFLWTGLILTVLAFPLLAQLALAVRNWPRAAARPNQFRVLWQDLSRSLAQAALRMAFLPYQAWLMLDAVGRTLFRMLIAHRNLLEWETAAATESRLGRSRWATFTQMGLVPLIAVLFAILLPPASRLAAIPFIAGWLIAPFAAHWINQPIRRRRIGVGAEQKQALRRLARLTWAFFETYVGPDDHWLPPDNFQEYPAEKLAHRVSPTNAGLYFVSALAARDHGYLGLVALVELCECSLASLERLERLHGHFYNWYDTQSLQPLFPRYLSTVDSGNLAACLLTMRQGLEELRSAPILSKSQWPGLRDTIDMAREACDKLHPRGARLVNPALNDLTDALIASGHHGADAPRDSLEWHAVIELLQLDARLIVRRLDAFRAAGGFPPTDVVAKVNKLVSWVENHSGDFHLFSPWTKVVSRLGTASHDSPADLPLPALPWNGVSSATQQLWHQLGRSLVTAQSLTKVCGLRRELAVDLERLRERLTGEVAEHDRPTALQWQGDLVNAVLQAAQAAAAFDERLVQLATRMESLALEMDFGTLYNAQRRLFSIGFNLEDGKLDRSHYDMLCSEARLASYLAIAKGDVEPRHWFQLGRPLTQVAGAPALLSWGGTMFEYLMPSLFQRDYEGSLLYESCQGAVERQREYGKQHGVPWGISECAFGALASNSDYHYRSFGVPGLGLKRGLGKDLVISPYSTMLALEIDSQQSLANLAVLEREGGLGPWGFYDAIDYTPHRLPAGKRSIIVRCYMAHHQGMTLVALSNMLFDGAMRRRFHAHPLPRASELLLQERVPLAAEQIEPHADEVALVEIPRTEDEIVSRRMTGIETPAPRTHLLGNGQYSAMITSTGGGYSLCRDLAVTRWRSDTTCDSWGQFIYLRDPVSQRVWSPTYHPTRETPDAYEVIYSIDKAEFRRTDDDLETHLEVAVSPENNAEVRLLTLTNHGAKPRKIEITSYGEWVLMPAAGDAAHPAFHKLFVETEYIAEETALLARRRPRDSSQSPVFGIHVLACHGDVSETIQYETSREAFLGRGRTPRRPAALDAGARLTGQTGAVLDPIFSLRCTVTIPARGATSIALTTGVATDREQAVALADQYHDFRGVLRAFELAWAFNQVQLRHLHLSPAKAHLYQRIAGALVYPQSARRGNPEVMAGNRQGQQGLWRYGISGDLPIALIHVTKPEHVQHVRELLTAHAYWLSHGLAADLVVLNDYPGSYLDALHEQLVTLLNESPRKPDAPPGRVFLLRGAQLTQEDKALLEIAAAVVLHGELGPLAQQWDSAPAPVTAPAASPSRSPVVLADAPRVSSSKSDSPERAGRQLRIGQLEFWNGIGGFADQGREYHLLLSGEVRPPMPWANVIANPTFGTLITEAGGGYTWFVNSRENKLTTWSNDPIADPPAEMLYVRDERTREIWSPLPSVLRDAADYWVEHGQGYTRFKHRASDVDHELLLSIAPDDPVKLIRLKLTNRGTTTRDLSLTYFAEWVLGVSRDQTQRFIQTEIDSATGALLARNTHHPDLPTQVAFLHTLGSNRSYTGDRTEFIGRNGSLHQPQALQFSSLSGRTGPGLDPCGAVQSKLRLAPGATAEIAFILGAGASSQQVTELLSRYGNLPSVERACTETAARWDEILSTVEVQTPNRALDLLFNRWLLYQTLSCRVWGRSAFYQAGGAYGFRDQLQDVMALVYSRPDLTREHLLRAAARQFEAGDVQHWWHPPAGRGTRTRFSDDYLWLPLATCHYIRATGDEGVLSEEASFVQSPPLEPHEQERYETPTVTANRVSLYEHCLLALQRGLSTGPHGLPLIGCGDWNDGMNRVGERGQGESVWVGWFQLVIFREFIPLMRARGDSENAAKFESHAAALRQALEQQAWDGQWYRRAFFDDGTPLGSIQNDECQIDSIAQTWAVLADADPERTKQAVQTVLDRLVRRSEKLVLLFAPPFDRTALDPGYIKGYVPGIRENGGQYTHPALWLIQALAHQGRADDALAIFDLIAPIQHSAAPQDTAKYRVEPYVVAADVYGVPPHTGRGGWTWYTGSAAWMYRVILESLLGFEQRGNRVRISPQLPRHWHGFEIKLRHNQTTWQIYVSRASDQEMAPSHQSIDGFELIEDGKLHKIAIGARETQ